MKFGEYVQLKHHPKGFMLWKRCFLFCFSIAFSYFFWKQVQCLFVWNRCYSSTNPNAIRASDFGLEFMSRMFHMIFKAFHLKALYMLLTHIVHCLFFSYRLAFFDSKQMVHFFSLLLSHFYETNRLNFTQCIICNWESIKWRGNHFFSAGKLKTCCKKICS